MLDFFLAILGEFFNPPVELTIGKTVNYYGKTGVIAGFPSMPISGAVSVDFGDRTLTILQDDLR